MGQFLCYDRANPSNTYYSNPDFTQPRLCIGAERSDLPIECVDSKVRHMCVVVRIESSANLENANSFTAAKQSRRDSLSANNNRNMSMAGIPSIQKEFQAPFTGVVDA